MKTMIVINGTMGVGKSTVCRELYSRLERSVWLDGDWCWMMHPWHFSEENKAMVLDNIAYLLRSFLQNSYFDYVVFGWVIHDETILSEILQRLQGLAFDLYRFTLTCSPEALRARALAGGRDEVGVGAAVERLALYESMDTHKVDTTALTPGQVAERILALLPHP